MNWRLAFALAALLILLQQASAADAWWNSSWHYRMKIEINATNYSRYFWPVEQDLNFTALLQQAGGSGAFNASSIRVFEQNSSTGAILYEVRSQFDNATGFSSTNAVGTLVFLLNGTTNANAKRIFYAYYDVDENGAKPAVNYSTKLAYSWDGEEFNVNNSILRWWVDTIRGENLSGLYRTQVVSSGTNLFNVGATGRPAEYNQYWNGTHNMSFDFRNNATRIIDGPIRIVVEQIGDEVLWNTTEKTNQTRMVKRYIFYENLSWIKIEQNLTAFANVSRNSTPAGALAFEASNAFGANYQSRENQSNEPGSWSWAAPQTGGWDVGIINYIESHTNFSSTNNTPNGRIGIQLTNASIAENASISETAVMNFNYTQADYTWLQALSLRFITPPNLTQSLGEERRVVSNTSTDYAVYNRNESAVIRANVSDDIYNLTSSVNATLDMGTPATGDDQTIIMYDDGTHGDSQSADKIFTNIFNFSQDATVGQWNITSRKYNSELLLLNQSFTLITVTANLSVSVTVTNPYGTVGRTVNATVTVQNYRNDTYHAGATLNCLAAGNPVDYLDDRGNGTYWIGFVAPPVPGTYALNCSANKTGNWGWRDAVFTADAATVNFSISAFPSAFSVTNVSLGGGSSVIVQINATNTGNGTAHYSNITIQVPSGWSAVPAQESCGDLIATVSCVRNFTITIPSATTPALYQFNATIQWINPDESPDSNQTTANVTVASNPVANVFETLFSSALRQGIQKTVGNFTLMSLGNDALQNITFTVSGLEGFLINFTPVNLSSLAAGANYSVQINATASMNHLTGVFVGTVNVSSQNDGWDSFTLQLNVSGTNATTELNQTQFVADNITQSNSQSYAFTVNATNVGNITAHYANITLAAPPGWSVNSSSESCGNLSNSSSCVYAFTFTVPSATPPGNYSVNVSFNWVDLEIGGNANRTFANVSVPANPVMQVLEQNVSGNASHGNNSVLANVTVLSIGNSPLYNVSFNATGFSDFTVNFTPVNLSSLAAGANYSIQINVTVPVGYSPGTYEGMLNVTTQNNGFRNIAVNVTVPIDRSWNATPSYCIKGEFPDAGDVCTVLVNNSGNVILNFSITPAAGNHTSVNETSFIVLKQSGHWFKVSYNVSGVAKTNYFTDYLIAPNVSANPANKTLQISLVPTVTPTVQISNVTPNKTPQTGSVEIYANITDNNLIAFYFVEANVTAPNGATYAENMTMIVNASPVYTYYIAYPEWWGSTLFKGNYTVTVKAVDRAALIGTGTQNFTAYARITPFFAPGSMQYYKGNTGSIIYRAREAAGSPLQNTNVTITITNPDSLAIFNESFATGASGYVEPLPLFILSADATVGNYSMQANAAYFDSDANLSVSDSNTTSFEVMSGAQPGGGGAAEFTGLFGEVSVQDQWFFGETLRIGLTVHDANGTPIDLDGLNLTVYNPNDALFFTVDLNNFTKLMTGSYTLNYSLPSSGTEGVYLAFFNLTKGNYSNQQIAFFRISQSMLADLETTIVWYPDSTMKFGATFYSSAGNPIDPDSIRLTVYDPAGNVYFTTTSFTKRATGYYEHSHAMASGTASGMYLAHLNATKSGSTTQRLKAFRVSSGGPFDVRLDLLENEVFQEDYLDFNIYAENKGEVSQDIDIEYWVSDGQVWYHASEAVFVASGGSVNLQRSAYIYSDQPVGMYYLNTKVTYDLVKPPILKNSTFLVKSKTVPTVTPSAAPPAGGGGAYVPMLPNVTIPPTAPGAPRLVAGIEITSYPDEIASERGWTRQFVVDARNTGTADLHDVGLFLRNVDASWLEIKPSSVKVLHANESVSFIVRLAIPESAPAGQTKIRLQAVAQEARDEKTVLLNVFESKQALAEYELEKLDARLKQLVKETDLAKQLGKAVEGVYKLIDEITNYSNSARFFIRKDQPDEALDDIRVANNLLEKATYTLANAPLIRVEEGGIPLWLILLIAAIIAGTAAYIIKKRRLPKIRAKPRVEEVQKAVEAMRIPADQDSLKAERDKIQRILTLLEEERKQGIISESAFNEMKRRNEERLAAIERKLGGGPK
jgi:uncharacterized membrane protein